MTTRDSVQTVNTGLCGYLLVNPRPHSRFTVQKMKFSVKDFFIKYEQIRRKV